MSTICCGDLNVINVNRPPATVNTRLLAHSAVFVRTAFEILAIPKEKLCTVATLKFRQKLSSVTVKHNIKMCETWNLRWESNGEQTFKANHPWSFSFLILPPPHIILAVLKICFNKLYSKTYCDGWWDSQADLIPLFTWAKGPNIIICVASWIGKSASPYVPPLTHLI